MTTTTVLDRLAESAVAARGGADLYRFGLHDRIPDASFKANSDGSVTVTGIDLLKAGTFNGLGLVDADLAAMVEHFVALRDAGIFVPPFRLDHSWSIMSVVGYFEHLETYRRTDATDGVDKAFLRGDVRLTGSLDYTADQLVKAIKRGALRNRSSELGYYVTNAGVEIPLAFYGCAFVDIPAVEGLAPVTLSRAAGRPEPAKIVNLTSTEGPTMTPEQTARLAALRAMTELSADEEAERDELDALDQSTRPGDTPGDGTTPEPVGSPDAPEAGTDPGTPDAPAVDDLDVPPADGTDADGAATSGNASAGDTTPGQDADTVAEGGTPAGGTEPAPTGAPADEVQTLRREIAALREQEATRTLDTFARAGVIVDANREDASALLRHDDPEVRRATSALLTHVGTVVALGQRTARTALTQGRGGTAATPTGGATIELGMSPDEVGDLWSSLTTQERKDLQHEYDAWSNDQRRR